MLVIRAATLLVLMTKIVPLQFYQRVLRCSQSSPPKEIRYYFYAGCKMSNFRVITAKSVSTLEECETLASRKRAFAFNFVHKALLHPEAANFSKESCVLFECPQFEIRQSEVDSVYDYYTAYATSSPKANVSCIPKVGVFQLHKERKAFDDAEEVCGNEGGMLADIATDLHTTHLSSLMSTLNVSKAYAGLRQWNDSNDDFLSSKGLPLSCMKFRAWAPNEPRPIKQDKCVYLTSKGYWKVRDCRKKLPFLCEVEQQGPLKPCRHIRNSRRRKSCLRKFVATIPKTNRDPKCGDPATKRRNEKRNRQRRKKQKKQDNATESTT